MKLFTLSFAAMLFATVSFAQIPITTNNACDPSLPPGGPACSTTATPPTAPQPQMVPCTPAANTLLNTNWAFRTNGTGQTAATALAPANDNRWHIGTFSITGRGGNLAVNGTMSTTESSTPPLSLGTLQRLASFTGSIDGLCLAGTNTLAAGTIQVADGLGGFLLTWSYPITATIQLNRTVTYAVTAVNVLNFSRYGALDPIQFFVNSGRNDTNGYGYNNSYTVAGTANQIVSQLACPVGAENTILQSAFGYSAGAGTQLIFTATPGQQSGTVTGRLRANANNGASSGPPNNTNVQAQPNGTEVGSYMVYPNCTGFCMNFPLIVGGLIVGSSWEGVFAAGDFSRVFIMAMSLTGDAGTNGIIGPIVLNRNTSAPVLDPFPPVPTGR